MQVFVFVLSVNVQHTERNALLYRAYTNIQLVRHWCRSVGLVPKCPESIQKIEDLQIKTENTKLRLRKI